MTSEPPEHEGSRGSVPDVVAQCMGEYQEGRKADRAVERQAVRAVLDELQAIAPGRSVEVRVPPYAAVQIVAGPVHRRGTPPAMVQLSAEVLVRIAVGDLAWRTALAEGLVRASGERSDLSRLFPLYD